MTRVVTVLNQKGGVGKSTAVVNLAAVRAQKLTADLDPDAFSPVAAVSIDPQGSAKWWANRVDSQIAFREADILITDGEVGPDSD